MEIAQLYVAAQRSFVEMFVALSEADREAPVPCTPGWSVRDVLSHAAGVADDITHGRVEGAATPSWTAAQVERWRDTPWADLVERWAEQAPSVGTVIEQLDEVRPPIDCHSHEHDIRQALGEPGNRDSEVVEFARARFDDPSVAPIGLSAFEMFRSRLGRRSRSQVLAYEWDGPVTDDVLGKWFVFGPSAIDIIE